MPHVSDIVSGSIPDTPGHTNAIQDKMARFYKANGSLKNQLQDSRLELLETMNQDIMYGDDQITNSNFSSAAAWAEGPGWTTSGAQGAKITSQVADSYLTYTLNNIAAGQTRLTILIQSIIGQLEVQVGGIAIGPLLASAGQVSVLITVPLAGSFRLRALPGTVATVKKVNMVPVASVGPGLNQSAIQDLWSYYCRMDKGYEGAISDQRSKYWAGGKP